MKCAATAMSSKLIARQRDFFSVMVVDAVSLLDDLLPLNMIGVKKVKGGSLEVRANVGLATLVHWKCTSSSTQWAHPYYCRIFSKGVYTV